MYNKYCFEEINRKIVAITHENDLYDLVYECDSCTMRLSAKG